MNDGEIMNKIKTPDAFQALKNAVIEDPDYAWSWHCNIAMPLIDAGVNEKTAQEAAATVMRNFFGVDTRESPHYATARGIFSDHTTEAAPGDPVNQQ